MPRTNYARKSLSSVLTVLRFGLPRPPSMSQRGSPAKVGSGLMLMDRSACIEVHGTDLDCPKVLQCQPANARNLLQFLDLNAHQQLMIA